MSAVAATSMVAAAPEIGPLEIDRDAECSDIASAVREHVLAIGARPVGTHLGGSLSATDILVALYFRVMRVRPDDPAWSGRDRFVLSKGHASAALYATLAERGFIAREELATYGSASGRLMAHPTVAIPGVEFATGSLGHGLSLGVGLALALRRQRRGNRVFVLLGDGELQEGSVWEAAMSAPHLGLDNLTAIVDRNGLQINGPTEERMALEPLADKWRSFGWGVSTTDSRPTSRS
jgi:transketolase